MSTTTIKLWLLVVLLAAPCQAATQVIRYVDPDASGGADGTSWTDAYTSLSTALETEKKDLQAADEKWTFYCRSSGGTADTGAIAPSISGTWNPDATRYVEVVGFDFPSNGVWDDTAYRIECTNRNGINISCDFARLSQLQISVTVSETVGNYGVQVSNQTSGSDVRIDRCIIKGSSTETLLCIGIYAADQQTNLTVSNCVIYGFRNGSTSSHTGINSSQADTVRVYNCTVYDCFIGMARDSFSYGEWTVTNCAVGNCDDDMYFSVGAEGETISYCCTDDGDGTNAVDLSPSGTESDDWASAWTDPSNGDFHVKDDSSVLDDAGTDNPGSGLYSDDITDTARVSTWDIGAFELESTATGGGQVMGTIIVKEHDILRGTRTGIRRGL